MKILSIGNSFSQDAQRYLNRIAQANEKELKNVNLCIGGCTLRRHFINMQDNVEDYMFELNGEISNIYVSLSEAVMSDDWDIITVQQASHESYDETTYTPFIEELCSYLRIRRPNAKIYIHQTWGYPEHKERLEITGFATTKDMFDAVQNAYNKAYKAINADGMIRSGEAMLEAYNKSPMTLHRDAFHASYGFGRYLLANVWYKELFGEVPKVHLSKLDEDMTSEELDVVKSIIEK